MRVLVVGAGLIGTVYGAHLAAAGSTVPVLSHGPRTGDVAAGGLCARDVLSGGGPTGKLPWAALVGALASLLAWEVVLSRSRPEGKSPSGFRCASASVSCPHWFVYGRKNPGPCCCNRVIPRVLLPGSGACL